MTEPALMVLLDASKCMAEARTPEECCDVLLKSIDFLGVTEGWIAVTDPQERAIKVRSVFGGDAPSLAISQDVARFVAEQLSQSPRAAVLPKEAWPLGAFGSEVQEVLFVPLVANGRWLGAMVLKAPAGCAIGLDQFRMLADHAAIHLGNALLRADHERTILYLREYDDLVTKLPNRIRFRRVLREALASGETAASLAVLFADLDSFNAVNQRYGYSDGDRVLWEVGDRWRQTLQPVAAQAMLARMGGDEFACLLVAPVEVQHVEAITQRLLDSLRVPLLVQSERCQLTASIGIARSPEHGREVEELLRSAELAMISAKAKGKGTWCMHSASANRTSKAQTPLQTKG